MSYAFHLLRGMLRRTPPLSHTRRPGNFITPFLLSVGQHVPCTISTTNSPSSLCSSNGSDTHLSCVISFFGFLLPSSGCGFASRNHIALCLFLWTLHHRLLRYRMSNKRNVRDRTVRSRAVRPSCVIPCGSCEFESTISSPFVFPQGTATATRRLHTVRVHVAGQLAILPRARTTAVDNFPIFFGAAARMSIVCISYPTPRCCCRRLLRWFRYAWLYEPRIVGHRNQQG
jgi:hypothetical protein